MAKRPPKDVFNPYNYDEGRLDREAKVVKSRRGPARTGGGDSFSQPIKALQRQLKVVDSKVASSSAKTLVQAKVEGIEQTLKLLRVLLKTLHDNLDLLAQEGVDVIQTRVKSRGEEQFNTIRYWYKLGSGPKTSTGPSRTLRQDFEKILNHLSVRKRVAKGSYGFGSRAVLDRIQLRISDPPKRKQKSDRDQLAELISEQVKASRAEFARGDSEIKNPLRMDSTSPYKISWQIIEFGTGQYAEPNRRLWAPNRPTKIQAYKDTPQDGSWYWLPNIQVYGQRGLHFLFGTAANRAAVLEDRRLAEEAIAAKLQELYRKHL